MKAARNSSNQSLKHDSERAAGRRRGTLVEKLGEIGDGFTFQVKNSLQLSDNYNPCSAPLIDRSNKKP